MPDERDILTLKEAANYLRVSESSLLRLLKDRKIQARKVGRQWRFSRRQLLDYVERMGKEEDNRDEDI